MPEVRKLIGGALIAAGVGGAAATIASGVGSTPLVVGVWLLALLAGGSLIVHGERRKKTAAGGSETTTLATIEARDLADEKVDRGGSVDGAGSARAGRWRRGEGTGIEVEAWPAENFPTTDFMPVPRSHSHLLDKQSGGDYLIWTPDHPEEEAGPGNEAKVHKLVAGEWLYVGRAPKSDIQFSLDYTPVSRKHAAVKLTEPGILLVRDLGSLNGTWVNGESVATYCRLNGERAMPVRADADIVIGRAAISYGWRPVVRTRRSAPSRGARSPG